MEKYMSIITNFGCHGKCPYCIVRENGIDVPKTTLSGLTKLIDKVKENNCHIIFISGGGDPLHNYETHKDYYNELFNIALKNTLPLEMHTSYIDSNFPMEKCKRVVYHLRNAKDLQRIKRIGEEIIRVVFVVTEEFCVGDLLDIAWDCRESDIIDELSFRQMVNDKYEPMDYLHRTLQSGHKLGYWHYIEQNDYNLYYVNGEVYNKFSDIHN